jgi:hypothetical protein
MAFNVVGRPFLLGDIMSGDTPYLEADDYDVEVDIDDYEDYGEGGGGAGGAGGKGKKGKAPRAPKKVKSVVEYLATHKNDKTYNRVLKASQKHPGASLYELQHGVGSKASTRYRAHQNPSKPDIDHAAIHRAFQESGYKVLRDGEYVRGAITGVHGSKVVLYGGTFVYEAKKDKGHRYDRVTEELLAQVEARLHHPRRSR